MKEIKVFHSKSNDWNNVIEKREEILNEKEERMKNEINSLKLNLVEKECEMKKLKEEIEIQKLMLEEKEEEGYEKEFEKKKLRKVIETQRLHLEEKERKINVQSDIIERSRSKCVDLSIKNQIAQKEIKNLKFHLEAASEKIRVTTIRSSQFQQKFIQIKGLYEASQNNFGETIDMYYKQIESMNEYIETLHNNFEQNMMIQFMEQSIQRPKEPSNQRDLYTIPEDEEDSYCEEKDNESNEVSASNTESYEQDDKSNHEAKVKVQDAEFKSHASTSNAASNDNEQQGAELDEASDVCDSKQVKAESYYETCGNVETDCVCHDNAMSYQESGNIKKENFPLIGNFETIPSILKEKKLKVSKKKSKKNARPQNTKRPKQKFSTLMKLGP